MRSRRITELWLYAERFGIITIFILVVAVFAAIDPNVLRFAQMISVLNRSSWVAVAAAGMTFAICSGGFDLSVGSIMSLCGCVLARTIMINSFSTGIAVLVTLGVAVCCGLMNGLLITKLKIQPFVATLATMLIIGGVTQTYTKNIGTYISNELYGDLYTLGRGMITFFPVKVLLVIALFSLAMVLYSNTQFGTRVRAVGSNEAAARTSGIHVDNVLMVVYVLTAVTAALAAILYTSTVQSASPDAGSGFELDVITAVVLGGSALSGGKGNIWGTYAGAVLVSFTKMCLNMISAPEAMQVIVKGVILLLALSLSGIKLITQREEQ